MAQVSFSAIEENDSRTAARVNTPFSSYQTQSTNLQENNFRHEGIERRNMAAGVVTGLSSSFVASDGTTTAHEYTGAGFTALTLHATQARVSSFTIGTNQVARVRFSIDLRRYANNFNFDFALFQRIGGVTTEVAATRRRLNYRNGGTAQGADGWGPFAFSKLLTTAATYEWVEVRVDPNGAGTPNGIYLSAFTLQVVVFAH